jgi:hypothetical protein
VTNGKIQQHACIKFCVKLGKSTTEPLKMLHKAFKPDSPFEWYSYFKAVREDDSWGWPSTSKTDNAEKNLIIHQWSPLLNNLWARRQCCVQLWGSPDAKRKSEHEPHCHKVCSPSVDKWPEPAACKRVLNYERRLKSPMISFCLTFSRNRKQYNKH